MALKILKEIGTNKGITSGAYIRIYNYQISKAGYLQLNIQMFLSEEKAVVPFDQIVAGDECFNSDIQNMVKIPLVRKGTKTVKKTIQVEEEHEFKIPVLDDNGNYTNEFRTEKVMTTVPKEVDAEEEYDIPDLSLIQGVDVFAFGYAKLKEKLQASFGAENIVDC